MTTQFIPCIADLMTVSAKGSDILMSRYSKTMEGVRGLQRGGRDRELLFSTVLYFHLYFL